jgi:uncharacterized surface protein with fasciclin (FAS1) repeats
MTQFRPTRRLALQTGFGVAGGLAFPAAALAGEPFFVDISTPPPGAHPHTDGDVLETAAAAGQFSVFLRALRTAGYEETLRGPGPFTVFAPTDDGFARMERSKFERLMAPNAHNELLSLLSYHVVPGRLTTASMHGRAERMHAANGYEVTIDGNDGLRINDNLVALPDMSARNGVVQGINAVLSPPVVMAMIN